jgi:hypothetical protein
VVGGTYPFNSSTGYLEFIYSPLNYSSNPGVKWRILQGCIISGNFSGVNLVQLGVAAVLGHFAWHLRGVMAKEWQQAEGGEPPGLSIQVQEKKPVSA